MEEEEEMAPSSWFPLSEDLSIQGLLHPGSCSSFLKQWLDPVLSFPSAYRAEPQEPLSSMYSGQSFSSGVWTPLHRSSSKLLNFNNPEFPFVPPALGVAVAFSSSFLCNA